MRIFEHKKYVLEVKKYVINAKNSEMKLLTN